MIDPQRKRTLRNRLVVLLAFVVAIWAIQVINATIGYRLNDLFGLIPRRSAGLDGVLGMPLLHNSYDHLIANTPPLVLMGVLLAVTATRALIAVNGIIVVVGGLLVWVFGSTAIHIGASGLIFGWFGFLVARGLVDRSVITLATSLLIAVVYGSMIWGVVPGQIGISWEAHLFGAVAGVLAAVVVRGSENSTSGRSASL